MPAMRATFHIVTGILGSGKTSVCKHLLDAPTPHGSPAIVVGEFAEEGFDAQMLKTTGCRVVQVTSTGTGDNAKSYLAPIKQLLAEKGWNPILLETSGVTEIAKVAAELRSDPDVAAALAFGPTVTVLDAGAFRVHDEQFGPQLWAQVDVADVVIVNKTDKANQDSLVDIRARIRANNPDAKVLFAYMGQVVRHEVLGVREADETFSPRLTRVDTQDQPAKDFESFIYRSDKVVFDRVMLGHKMLNLPGRIARFKGVLRSWDRSYCVNGMPGQLDWDNTPVKGKTAIAFIGLGLGEHREAIHRILDDEIESQQDDR